MSVETLNDLFVSSCEKFPSNYAVIYSDGKRVFQKITYRQLAYGSNKVTQCLQELHASGFVGIFMDQSISFPAIVMGVLQNKLPFVCINIYDSEKSIHYIIEFLNIKWIFCEYDCPLAKVALSNIASEVKSVYVNKKKCSVWHVSIDTSNIGVKNLDQSLNLAYAIQTSGSTGTPKVVRVPHNCIVPNIKDISQVLDLQQDDVIFLGSPLTFDPSIVELFLPFTNGAILLITHSSVKASPPLLLDVLFPAYNVNYAGISVLQITPSSFRRWTSHDIKTRILNNTTTLKKLLFGGEPCPSISKLRSWRESRNTTKFFNVYGITEVSCWASLEQVYISEVCEEQLLEMSTYSSISMCSSLSETVIEIRNQKGEKVLKDDGELYIGSSRRVCLVNEEVIEELTCPVFRATGDIVKIDEKHKRLLFIGRKNRIIKRWGHQVCLTQVENILSKHSYVNTCCCVWYESKHILAAFVVWKEERNNEDLKIFSLSNLHRAAVPDQFISTVCIPLTNHGKVDYEALEFMVIENLENTSKGLFNLSSFSSLLSETWEKVLGARPQMKDNFISMGGNSVLALQLSYELENFYGECIRNKLLSMLFTDSSYIEVEKQLFSHISDSEVKFGETHSDLPLMNANDCQTSKILLPNKSTSVSKQNYVCDYEASVCPKNIQKLGCDEKLISVYCRGKILINEKEENFAPDFSEKSFTFKMHWKYNMKKCIDASPCCLNFKRFSWVVVGSHSHELAVLDCNTGAIVSKCELPHRIESSVCPSLCGKYGIVGCYDGYVYCISLLNGQVKWKFGTNNIVKSSPTLCLGGTAVIVGSYDSHLYCIKLDNGSLIWKTSASNGSLYSSPCISQNGHIGYGTLDGLCIVVSEQNGLILWKNQVASPIFTSPTLLYSYNAIIFSEVIGIVHCFSMDDGKKLWEFKANGNIFSSICSLYFTVQLYEILVFGCHDHYVYCLKVNENIEDVTLLWKRQVDSPVFAIPFMFPVKGLMLDKPLKFTTLPIHVTYLMIATSKGTVYIMDAKEGLVQISTTLPNEIYSSPVVCGDFVFIGCRDDFLYCFNVRQKENNDICE